MGGKNVRVYDLAKELKIDNKKAIEEIRREGVDVSVPSNSVPDDVAERIRNKYYPKKTATPARPILRKAVRPAPETTTGPDYAATSPSPERQPEPLVERPQLDAGQKPSQPAVRVLKPTGRMPVVEPIGAADEHEETQHVAAGIDESVDTTGDAYEAAFAMEPTEVQVEVESQPARSQHARAEAARGPQSGEQAGGVRVLQLNPTSRPAPSVEPSPVRSAPPPRGGTQVKVLTPKPGMEGHRPLPPPAPGMGTKPAPQAFEQSYEGGPLKAPSRTIYIPPPETKGRPKGLRGGRGGKPTGRRDTRPTGPLHGRDRVQSEGHQNQLSSKSGLGGLKRQGFGELKAIKLVEGTTLKDFAEKLDIKPRDVVSMLLGKGVMATINQTLNQEVAQEVGREFGYDVSFVPFEEMVIDTEAQSIEGGTGTLGTRAPVVTVMGHVDHGKTSLLDAIRSARVAEGEAGGITQHISAFGVDISDPDNRSRLRRIVFIDTPGHEAFTTMRARGAKVTDVVVLVVAADDGVMPQTVEAIDHARAAEVPIIVAINKIDKPEANPDRVKQELTQHGLLWDGYGGETVMVEISAKKQLNLDALLEMIVLTADLRELKAAEDRLAQGVVLDAFLDKGRGAVATILVQNGTLKVGDPFIVGSVAGKVRALFDDRGHRAEMAGPSTPVQVLGADGVPHAGDVFQVVDDMSKAQHISSFRQSKERLSRIASDAKKGIEMLFDPSGQSQVKELQVILKADVQGSVEAVRDVLQKLSSEKVKIRVVRAGVGAITESDVMLASAANKDMNRAAVIIGFNVRPETRADEIAKNEAVDIRLHTIIYKVQEEIRDAMLGMLDKAKREVSLGRAEVRDIIRVPKVGNVAGCMVLDGVIKRGAEIRLVRDNMVIFTGKIDSLRRFKEDVGEVKSGFECGVVVERYQDVRLGDVIEAFKTEEVAQTEL
jgi:translation initiation factor IF-2